MPQNVGTGDRQLPIINNLDVLCRPALPTRRTTFYMDCKNNISNISLIDLIPLVIYAAGSVLLVIGLYSYVYHIVQFVKAFTTLSETYSEGDYENFWDLEFFSIKVSLIAETSGMLLAAILSVILFRSLCSCRNMSEFSTYTQNVLKSIVFMLLAVIFCYLQTSLGFMRETFLIKMTRWLTGYDDNCRYLNLYLNDQG